MIIDDKFSYHSLISHVHVLVIFCFGTQRYSEASIVEKYLEIANVLGLECILGK